MLEVYEEIEPELKTELVDDVLLNRRPDATERLVEHGEALKAASSQARSLMKRRPKSGAPAQWRSGYLTRWSKESIEGNVTFHTARSTAFPQPAPGTAPSAGPMKVPDDKLRTMLGTASVTFKRGDKRLAIIDTPLKS